MRVVDTAAGESCKKFEESVSWNQKGPKGDNAPAEEYGVAIVRVQRGTGAATPWAVYSTELGSPVGDTTGGTFRFTCQPVVHETCRVSLQAKILSDSSVAPGTIYPRVLVYRGGAPDSNVEPDSTASTATARRSRSRGSRRPTRLRRAIR